MAHAATTALGVECTEAVAFMHLLHEVPAKPSINVCPQHVNLDSEGHSLPFEKERDITNTLAFLSNTRGDPNRVPALCIHESAVPYELEVIVAVNQAHHRDGRTSLENIKNGFDRVFHHLTRIPQTADTENLVFLEIVTMCSIRIRERMGYAPQKKKHRKPIKQLLEEVIALLGGKFGDFRQTAKTAIKSISSWLKHQTQERLCDIVEALHGSKRTEKSPQDDTEVARYREAARFLYRTAKKYPVLRHMKVVLAYLPKIAFNCLPLEHDANFSAIFARLQVANRRQSNFEQVARLLSRDGQAAEELFAKQFKKTMIEGKIHAEVQLIYYMETHQPEPKPRVVASSKMACFLCNTFLCQVAKVYTKRCHGRLYPGWKLPIFPSHCVMERLFVQTLECHIRTSIDILLSRKCKTMFRQPSESTLWTMKASVTTASRIREPADGQRETAQWPEPSANLSHESKLEIVSQPDTDAKQTAAASIEGVETSLGVITKPHRPKLVTLQRGTNTTVTLCAPGAAPVQAGRLLVQLEYTVGHSGHIESRVDCGLEWLAREDADAMKNDRHAYIVNAETVDGEITIPAEKVHALYIATAEDVVRIDLWC